MHGRRVAQRDVVLQVVALEHDARLIGESFGRRAIRVVVDPGHPSAVAVADLIDPVTGTSGADVDGAVLLRLMMMSPRRICWSRALVSDNHREFWGKQTIRGEPMIIGCVVW